MKQILLRLPFLVTSQNNTNVNPHGKENQLSPNIIAPL